MRNASNGFSSAGDCRINPERKATLMAADTIHILHIEDNPLEAALMRELVSVSIPEQHELHGVGNLQEAFDRLRDRPADLILTDLSLPDSSGMETIQKLASRAPGIPIIVLSGYDDEKTSIEALRAGAQDYLVKGEVSSHLLRHAIRYAMERKRLDAALAIERDLVDNLLENIPDRIYFKDVDSRYLRINRAMAEVIGVGHPVEAIGRSDHDFFSSEHANAARADERRVIETGKPLIGHVEKERLSNGRDCWVLTTKMPLLNASGDVVGTFGISRDITQLKQAEEQLEGAIARNRQLADSLRQLAALTAEEVEAVAPAISDDDARRRKAGADQLRRAAERLRKISRLDQETEVRGEVDLKALFNEQAKIAADGRPAPELTFRPENFPRVIGNAELLGQLAVELLRAIFEAGEDRAVTLTANELKNRWEFTVARSESGPPAELAFQTIGNDRSFPANFLALSLCRRIAEAHDGTLLVAIDAGGGPAFRLVLPQ